MTTTRADAELAGRLAAYAAGLRATGALTSAAVEAAFATVPRHRFLPRFRDGADEYRLDPDTAPPQAVLDLIYANNALLTHTGRDGDPLSSSSAPSVMAKMLEALHLVPGLRVLEIGAGTGYNAALIHHITGADVVSVEASRRAAATAAAAIRALVLDQAVHVVHADGYHGHPDGAPYARVIVTCGIAGIPPTWLDQLGPEALIVAPVAHAGAHPILAAHRRTDGTLTGQVLWWADFMFAVGDLRPTSLFHHDPAVDIPATDARRIPDAGPALDQNGYQDLWCYLGTRDRRIARATPDTDVFDLAAGVCALVDPDAGTVWVHRDGSLTLAGDHQLADHLAGLVGEWDTAGRPTANQWRVDWRHADTGAADLLLPREWTLASGCGHTWARR